MGYELRRWLADRLPRDLSPGERLVALEIADLANDRTRRAYGAATLTTLVRRTGYANIEQIGKVLGKLARRGLELRVPVMGKDGRPITKGNGRILWACNGHELNFLVPDDSCPAIAKVARSRGLEESSPDRATFPPGSHREHATESPRAHDGLVPEARVDDAEARANSTGSPRELEVKPARSRGPSPHSPQDPSPLSVAERTIMDATGATAHETREIISIIKSEKNPTSLGRYVETLAANGDLGKFLDRVRPGGRAARSSTPVPPSYAELLARTPCPHGTPGGDQPHPGTGAPSCPLCRTGGAPEPKAAPSSQRAASPRDLTSLRAALAGITTRSAPAAGVRPVPPVEETQDPPEVRAAHAYLLQRGDAHEWLTTARGKLGDGAERGEVLVLAAELAQLAEGMPPAAVGGPVGARREPVRTGHPRLGAEGAA